MEVILKKDVEGLGFQDDLVQVKNGYGRNYLIPQGFAILATSSAKKVLAETLKQRAHREEKRIEDAKKVAKALEEVTIKIISKTADGSKLFGSVNNANVSEALEKQGHAIEKKFISIDGNNIKRLGKYVAHIRLHRELIVDFPFEVIADPASLPKKKKEVVAPKEEAPKEEVAESAETESKETATEE
jgi:large subunit ribosomal protein L9